jgi:hypothetical protein
MAVYLRDQRRGLSARHYRVDNSRCSRRRRIYPNSIRTRLINGNWYVRDYVVFFLLDTRRRQMERIHRPNCVEPHRRILVQRYRSSLRLYRVVFGITAKENRPASVELNRRPSSQTSAFQGRQLLSELAAQRSIVDVRFAPESGHGREVIHAPGHCAGEVALLWRPGRMLFAADVCMNLTGLGDPVGFESLEEGLASQRKLAGLSFDAAGFGQGAPIARDASAQFRYKWGQKFAA